MTLRQSGLRLCGRSLVYRRNLEMLTIPKSSGCEIISPTNTLIWLTTATNTNTTQPLGVVYVQPSAWLWPGYDLYLGLLTPIDGCGHRLGIIGSNGETV